MAALGSILRKAGSSNPSAHRTTQYEKLAQDPSDNEEEDDVLFRQYNGIEVVGVSTSTSTSNTTSSARTQNGLSKTHANGNQHESIEMDSMPTIHTARRLGNDVKVKLVHTGLLTRTRIACFIGVLLMGISIAFGFAFIVPQFTDGGHRSMMTIYHRSAPWTLILSDLGTESAVRLVDVDGDGKQDVLVGLMQEFGFRVSTTDMMQSLCKQRNLEFPCVGLLLALRGTDGHEIWRRNTYSGVTDLECDVLDVNSDGRKDCIVTGKMGTVMAIDTRNGSVLWRGDKEVLNAAWNVYNPLILPDLDEDGVQEILLAHGGDDAFPHAKLVAHKRQSRLSPGRLILLSGKTGKSLGRVFEVIRKHQTYMPPIMHVTGDGSLYILFGTGEARVPGSLFMISVPDLYRYVRGWNSTIDVPNVNGTYKRHSNLHCDSLGLCEIFSSSMKGLMVPPVCVDLTGDGVKDIAMAAYDGTVALFDGETFKEVWKIAFSGYEAHSAPAPAYFNDDDTLDLMLHLNHGTWPRFNHSKVIIVDGKTGKLLWSLQTEQHEMTSDLVVRTSERHRDAYIFRVQGRHGKKPFEGMERKRRAAPLGRKHTADRGTRDYDYSDYNDYGSHSDYPNYQYSPYLRGLEKYGQQYGQPGETSKTGYERTSVGDGPVDTWPPSQDRPMGMFDGVLDSDSLYPGYTRGGEGEDMAFGGRIPGGATEDIRKTGIGRPDYIKEEDEELPVAPPTKAPYVSPCQHDLNKYNTEVFIMDRTIQNKPLKVTEIPATKHYYNLTSSDMKLLGTILTSTGPSSRAGRTVRQAQSGHQAGWPGPGSRRPQPRGQHLNLAHHTNLGLRTAHGHITGKKQPPLAAPPPAQSLGPAPVQGVNGGERLPHRARSQLPDESRTRKRPPLMDQPQEENDEVQQELCTVMAASEMVTGSVGDVDGDGTLDLVLMFDREAQIRAVDGTYIRSEYVTEVTKINLVEVLARKELVPMNVTVTPDDTTTPATKTGEKKVTETSFFNIKFLPAKQQPWAAYLGTRGDSIYNEKGLNQN